MTDTPSVIVIPREKAVFRLDRNGRWRNASGLFRNRRIIDFFNAAIRRDEGGYYVSQQREHVVEKVYFPYEDTALFVVDMQIGEEITLVLNTGRRLPLETDRLYIENDGLYLTDAAECIKFSDRALLKLADRLDFEQDSYFIRAGGGRRRIRVDSPADRLKAEGLRDKPCVIATAQAEKIQESSERKESENHGAGPRGFPEP